VARGSGEAQEAHSRSRERSIECLKSSQDFARLFLPEAAEKYIAGLTAEIAVSSLQKEKQLLVKPKEYSRRKRLRDFSADNIVDYRVCRIGQGVGPAIINLEVGVLRRILKKAKKWTVINDEIRPLREPQSIGKALAVEEKSQLLKAAGETANWDNARLAMTLALCTTMRGVEIKHLRWRDVDRYRRT
jgi:integrase